MSCLIIIGAPRSGTSILAKILASHPDVTLLLEPRLVWKYGNDHQSDYLRVENATPAVRTYIRNYLESHLRESGRRVLVEKTPSNALRMEFVHAVLPEAKFIHIVRDGVESALSIRRHWEGMGRGRASIPKGRVLQRLREAGWRRLPDFALEAAGRVLPERIRPRKLQPIWGPRFPGIGECLRDMELLEICCLQWRLCVEYTCSYGRSLSSDCYREIRLENVDVPEVSELLEFSGLPVRGEVADYMSNLFKPGGNTGRPRVTNPDEQRLLAKHLDPTLDWLGYPTV